MTKRRGNTDAKKSELLEHNVAGGFPLDVWQELSHNKRLASEIVQDLLIANFPETIHQDIFDAVGIAFQLAPA